MEEELLTPSDFIMFNFSDNSLYTALEYGFNVSRGSIDRFKIKNEFLALAKSEKEKNIYRLISSDMNKSAFCIEYFSIPVINKEFNDKAKLLEYIEREHRSLQNHKIIWHFEVACLYNKSVYLIERHSNGIIDFSKSRNDTLWKNILFEDDFLEKKNLFDLNDEEQERIIPSNQALYLLKQHISKNLTKLQAFHI